MSATYKLQYRTLQARWKDELQNPIGSIVANRAEPDKKQPANLSNLEAWGKLYASATRPPLWTPLIGAGEEDVAAYSKVAHETQFLYTTLLTSEDEDKALLGDVLMLIGERVPVRELPGPEPYDKAGLLADFGIATAGYKTYAGDTTINLAVYTRLPYLIGEELEVLENRIEEEYLLHVISVIPPMLDAEDEEWFSVLSLSGPKAMMKQLEEVYYRVFIKIYYCASLKSCSSVMLCPFGLGPAVLGIEEICHHAWLPALARAQEEIKSWGEEPPVTCTMETFPFPMLSPEEMALLGPRYGKFPAFLSDFAPKELSAVLFVNEWDPVAVPGGGHGAENTLNGRFGRYSPLAYLGSAMNPHIFVDVISFPPEKE